MAKKNEIYKCEKSGLMVEVLQDAVALTDNFVVFAPLVQVGASR